MANPPEISVDCGTDDDQETDTLSQKSGSSVTGGILVQQQQQHHHHQSPSGSGVARHVSFDEGRALTEKKDKEREMEREKEQERERKRTTGFNGFQERFASRWGRSPSPAARRSSNDVTDDEDDNDKKRAEKEGGQERLGVDEGKKQKQRRRALSPAVRRRTEDEDEVGESGRRLEKLSVHDDSSFRRGQSVERLSSSSRKSFFGNKKFNPEDPETEEEKQTRRRLNIVTSFIRKQRIGMMTSRTIKGWLVSSSIAIAEMEYGVDFMFHANTRTCKVEDLDDDNHVNLSFQNSETAEWVSIAGIAKLVTDSEAIAKFLSRNMKGWSDEDSKLLTKKDQDKKYPTVGIIHFETRSIAFSVTDDFKFIPMSNERGIVKGEIAYTSQTIKIDELQIKHYRKRQKHLASKRRVRTHVDQ